MSGPYCIDAWLETEHGEDIVETRYLVYFSFSRGSPAVMYQRNGDPGWPADPDEIEFISAKDDTGKPVTDGALLASLDKWLDDNYEKACEIGQDAWRGRHDHEY